MSQDAGSEGRQLFLRPEGLLANGAFERFKKVLGVTPATELLRLPVFEFGEENVWPVTVQQLQRLGALSEYVFRRDYLVFVLTRRRERKTGRFMAKLVSRSYFDELIKERTSSPRSRSGRAVPSYEYFVHSLGETNAATVAALLAKLGLPCGDDDLIQLELGPKKKIPGWLIPRDAMFTIRDDGRLNSWRHNLFYRRNARTGAVTRVPEDFFMKIRSYVLKRHLRRAVELERFRDQPLALKA